MTHFFDDKSQNITITKATNIPFLNPYSFLISIVKSGTVYRKNIEEVGFIPF